MKFSSFRLALLVTLALLAFGCNGKRIAVVNTDILYKESVVSEKATQYLQTLSSEMQKVYTEAAAKVEKAKTKQEKEVAQAEMQVKLMELQQRFTAEQQQVAIAMTNASKKAMETCRVKGKFDMVLPAEIALSHAPELDITKQVVEEMNTIPVEFTPIAPENPAPTEKPAQ